MGKEKDRIDFVVLDDGIIEGRHLDNVYCIFTRNDRKNEAACGVERLYIGNLYECLDACNKHAFGDNNE